MSLFPLFRVDLAVELLVGAKGTPGIKVTKPKPLRSTDDDPLTLLPWTEPWQYNHGS